MATLYAKVLAQYLKDTFPPTGPRKEEMKRKTEHRLWEEASPFFTSRRGGRAPDEAGTAADASRFARTSEGSVSHRVVAFTSHPLLMHTPPSGERARERAPPPDTFASHRRTHKDPGSGAGNR